MTDIKDLLQFINTTNDLKLKLAALKLLAEVLDIK